MIYFAVINHSDELELNFKSDASKRRERNGKITLVCWSGFTWRYGWGLVERLILSLQ